MSIPKQVRISLKLNAQPKQFHALTVDVEAVYDLEPGDVVQDVFSLRGNEVSKALEERILQEVTKFYGEAACKAAMAGYFTQSKPGN